MKMKPTRRSKDQIAQLEAQIMDVLREDHPQSVRHVFYRMTDPRLPEPVEKSQAGYRQVQDRITRMRKAGRLAYGWISDLTRRGFPRFDLREWWRADHGVCQLVPRGPMARGGRVS